MFERIVQRNLDGKYAIKRLSLFPPRWEYKDLHALYFWWSLDDCFSSECWTDNYRLISKLFYIINKKKSKRKQEEIVIKIKH